MRRTWVVLLVLVACEDEPQGLTLDRVRDVQGQEGDAHGYDWSGTYLVAVDPVDCPCETTPIAEISYCSAAKLYPGEAIVDAADVVQTDGTLLMRTRGIGFYGPVWSDGSFVVGEAINLSSVITEGFRASLMEGDIEEIDGVVQFEATMQVRTRGQVLNVTGAPGSVGGLGGAEEIDCTETVEVTAARTSP